MSLICADHTDEDVRFHCEECDRLICDECLLGGCATHTKVRLRHFIERKKEILKERLHKLEEEDIPRVKKNLSEVNETQAAFNTNIEKTILKVKSRTEVLKTKLDEINDDIVNDLNNRKETANDTFNKYLETENKKLTQMENTVKEANLESIPDGDILKMDTNAIKLDLTKKLSIEAPLYTQIEYDDKEEIKKLHGFIDEQNVYEDITYHKETITEEVLKGTDFEENHPKVSFQKYLEKFNSPKDAISLAVRDMDNCWLSGTDAIWEVVHGNKLKIEERLKMDFTHTGIALTKEGEVLVACRDKRYIKLLKPGHGTFFKSKKNEYQMVKFLSTNPLFPLCICTTPSDDLLVCLRSNYQENIQGKSILRRHQLSQLTGKLLQEVELSTEKLQIDNPVSVAMNVTGDVYIVSRTKDMNSQLVCITFDGGLKFQYPQDRSKRHNFVGVSCLKDGIIVLLDCISSNSGLYVLDKNGILLHFEPKSPNPTCLAVDDADNMWIGYESGEIETITSIFEHI